MKKDLKNSIIILLLILFIPYSDCENNCNLKTMLDNINHSIKENILDKYLFSNIYDK